MVMNKLWKTLKHAPTLIEMVFLCMTSGKCDKDQKMTVKQP
jgi:hypothetical protein